MVDWMEKHQTTVRMRSHQKRLCRRRKLVMVGGEENRCMLTTGFDMCQGSDARSREITELSAGTQHVAATTFPDEDVDAGLAHDRLERQDVEVGRPAEGTAGKWVEGNQINLACDPADQFDQTQGIGLAVVHAG